MSQAPSHPTSSSGRPTGGPPGSKPRGSSGGRPQAEPPDLSEKGAPVDGEPRKLDRRLFMQLLAFGDCVDTGEAIAALKAAGVKGALYEDANDPNGIAIVTLSEDPNFFVDTLRPLLKRDPFASMTLKDEYTMLGRTYTIGYETDLEETLFTRPTRNVLNPDCPWAVWYPLRRAGSFEQLDHNEQRAILGEHGMIGMSFGAGGFAADIRLACHGLDKNDNDFVIGLIGKELYPLSALVQTMRKTKQTSLHLERLGPFFVGKVAWQSEQ